MALAVFCFILSCFGLLFAATFTFLTGKHRSASVTGGHILTGLALALAFVAGLLAAGGLGGSMELVATPPFGDIGIKLDRLAGFFIATIAFVGIASAIYAPRYVLAYSKGRGAAGLTGLHSLFLLSMLLVVAADGALGFLLAWEAMSLLSYFFVVYNHRKKENVEAGYLYLVMTHLGTAFIVIALLILAASAGSFDFEAMSVAGMELPSVTKDLVFVAALIGFGTKAGVVPMHLWLPAAHPAAPSHVSALMSGVMIKTAIYGLIRVVFEFLGADHAWWGIAILAIGAVSAVLGVMYALMEHDLKRLLAFHSVENIGIILLGVGAAAVFVPLGMTAAAAIALIAALFHVANHALFKSLLFQGTGAIILASGTRDIEKLGGLGRTMPVTAALFLLGAAAISAMPPLNGFVSEWLTFQSLLAGAGAPDLTARLAVPAAAAALALTGGLAAACFVKAYGITFLGRPRTTAAGDSREVPKSMIAGMGLLAVACLTLGLLPGLGINLTSGAAMSSITAADLPAAEIAEARAAVTSLNHAGLGDIFGMGAISVRPLEASTGIAPLATGIVILAGALLIAFLARRRLSAKTRRSPETTVVPWACGFPSLTPRMQYSATAFSKPLRIIFSRIYRPLRDTRVECVQSESPYFVSGIHYHAKLDPIYERLLYRPATTVVRFLGRLTARLQSGSIQSYLAYIFAVLITLLVVVR